MHFPFCAPFVLVFSFIFYFRRKLLPLFVAQKWMQVTMTSDSKKLLSVPEYERKHFFRNVAIGVVLVMVFFSLPKLCVGHGAHDHDHDHHHHEEPASFKWSQAANERYQAPDHHGHAHAHADSHAHAHSHNKVEPGKDNGIARMSAEPQLQWSHLIKPFRAI